VKILRCIASIVCYVAVFWYVFSIAVPSHTEGVVGLLDAAEGFPYGMRMNLFNFVDQSLKQIILQGPPGPMLISTSLDRQTARR